MSTQINSDPVATFSKFLRESLNDLLSPNATTFIGMLAENAVIEFPYTPPGGQKRVESQAAIEKYVAGVSGMLDFGAMTLHARHNSEGGVVILEFSCNGSGTQTGEPYNQDYISVITIRDGLIAHYRDYWNPLIALKAMGGNEAIAGALQGN
ncbi:nuclear transport factor 2 family protein [bacterium]|nr:MAG: nuclear transport factor 2 family protein [bacterium]